MPLHVIGLGRQRLPEKFLEVLTSGPVLVRDFEIASQWLGSLDIELNDLASIFSCDDVSRIPEMLLAEFRSAFDSSDVVTYLVPEAANVGDESVRLLSEAFELDLYPSAVSIDSSLGNVQVVDALALALAEARHPFDAGWADIDPATAAIVTNFIGSEIIELAGKRLERVLGSIPAESRRGVLVHQVQPEPHPSTSFEGTRQIAAVLRSPVGCPWDREQTVDSLLPMMTEELDEFVQAWRSEGPEEQADELGDVLFHIVMIAQITREAGKFSLEDVLRSISAKMIRRHPHVFGDVEIDNIEDLYRVWDEVKARERADKLVQTGESEGSRLDGGGA